MRRFWILLILLWLAAACKETEEVPLPTVTQVAIGGNVRIGSTVRDVLSEGVPSHDWTLSARQGNTVVIQLSNVNGNARFQLQLISPSGEILTQLDTQENDFAASIPFILPVEGDYRLRVSRIEAYTEGMYAISVADSSQILRPTLTGTPETPTLTFTPTSPTATQTPTVASSPTGDTTSPTPTIFLPQELPTSLPTRIPPPGGRLETGETRTGEITQAGEIHRFTFFGAAEETISLAMNPDPSAPGTLNPYLELQAPNGTIVAENDNWLPAIPDAIINLFRLPATGVYTLYVKSRDGTGTGRYLLSLSNSFTMRDVQRGEAVTDLPNEQRLETYGQRDVWTVNVEAGDLISIAVEIIDRASDFNVMVELVSPEGESWFDDDSGADFDAFLNSIEAPVSGTYTVHIAANNNASIGAYRLWWQSLKKTPTPITPTSESSASPAVPTATPIAAEIVGTVGELRSTTYPVQINAGQTVSIVVLGVEGFDSVLRVIDPIGNILVEVDDVGDSVDPRANFVAVTSGLYTIEISGFEGASGTFTLNYVIQ